MKLDFVSGFPPSGRAARGLALVGIAALAAAAARWYDSADALAAAQAQTGAARRGAAQKMVTARASAAEAAALGERVRALNGHIRALNFPWGSVLKAVQPPAALGVSVLRLELDGHSSVLHVAAQAEQP